MPWGLKRYQQTGDIHFITFSCYRRAPLLAEPQARDTFVIALEKVRRWYGFYVTGFVVMPEHVHLLLSEPERSNLAVVLQMLKQIVSHKLNEHATIPFWQPRYYDFNVRREQKLMEKLDYMHHNPVQRGLVTRPEDWTWSSARHYATGEEAAVEIESRWTARRREQLGVHPEVRRRDVS
jgi:putative transposase